MAYITFKFILLNTNDKSAFKTLNSACPNKFKPWELKQVPNSYWTLERGLEATKWPIEEKLKWSDDDISLSLYYPHDTLDMCLGKIMILKRRIIVFVPLGAF